MSQFGNSELYTTVKHTDYLHFWDRVNGKDTLVVATHGILKKTQKTPPKEIKKAEDIRTQYLEHKSKKK